MHRYRALEIIAIAASAAFLQCAPSADDATDAEASRADAPAVRPLESCADASTCEASRDAAAAEETRPPGADARAALRVPITLRARTANANDAAVFVGVPFPPAALTDANDLDLTSQGSSVARKVDVLSTYPDGSVRVALIGFRATLARGASRELELRSGRGSALTGALPWARSTNLVAMLPAAWYGESTVFNLRFQAGADNALAPAFEERLRRAFLATSNPPSSDPAVRNYYDHAHALYMTLLRNGPSDVGALKVDDVLRRIDDEVVQFRENEILHSGPYRGQYGGPGAAHDRPIPTATVRRMFVQGLLDDFYFTGDRRSLDVAKEMADAYAVDASEGAERFQGHEERTPAWEIMGLTAAYEATLEARYLDAARGIATRVLDHQRAMAVKYPNQGNPGGKTVSTVQGRLIPRLQGQTGGFLQDRRGRWFDDAESTASGAGSTFMTTLLGEGLLRVYWLTGDARARDGLLLASDWLVDACYNADDNAFFYVCVATDHTGTVESLNPMFLQMLGFAHQASGDPKYLDIAKRLLRTTSWGSHIKELNQAMHASGQGLYLLNRPPGTVPLTLAAASGR